MGLHTGKHVSERQEQGFEDNKRQHVLNANATMISMLLGQETPVNMTAYNTAWNDAVNYLNTDYTG